MLGKLIKHEFRATSRIMGPMLLVVLALSVLARFSIVVLENGGSNFLTLLAGLVMFAFVIGIIAANLMSIIVMAQRFYKNLLGDEGYLMFTLPASVHSIVWSKLIVSVVWFFATGLLMMLTIFVMVSSVDMLAAVKDIFRELGLAIDIIGSANISGYIFEVLLIIFLVGATTCLQFYAAMALGHSFANHKGILSVVFFFAISFAFQFISTQIIVVLNHSNAFDVFNRALSQAEVLAGTHKVLLSFAVYILAGGAINYVITTLTLKKRLNLA